MGEENTQMEEQQYQLPYTLKLSRPFQYGKDREITEITFNRRTKAKDYKGIQAQNIRFDDILRLISKTTGESMSLIEELDSEDMMAAVDVVNSFLPSGQTVGKDG